MLLLDKLRATSPQVRANWLIGIAILAVIGGLGLFAVQTNWPVSGSVRVSSAFGAELQVPETDIALVLVGQPAELHLLAYPGQTAAARVVNIGNQGNVDEDGRVTFTVLLSITAAPGMTLRQGMTGSAEVVVARDALFYVWSGRASRAWLTWWQAR